MINHLLVSVGHLCILLGLFSEIDNLSIDNCIDNDVVMSHRDGVCANMKKDVIDTSKL